MTINIFSVTKDHSDSYPIGLTFNGIATSPFLPIDYNNNAVFFSIKRGTVQLFPII